MVWDKYNFNLIMILTILLLLSCTTVIFAEDTTAPEIIHEEVAEAPSNTPLRLNAKIEDESRIERVTLFFRTEGTGEYYKTTAKAKADGGYEAVIASNFLQPGNLEYYWQAEDVYGNTSTLPVVNAFGDPLELRVEQDQTIPGAQLVSPNRMVGNEDFLVLILLDDEAGNINLDTVEIYFNGQDVKSRAQISSKSIRFTVDSREVETFNKVLLKVEDKAGNELEKSFRISQHPIISGDYKTEAEFGQSSEVESQFSLKGQWGAFSATADLAGEGLIPIYNEELDLDDSEFNLSFGSRFLDIGAIDTNTTTSDLSASGYNHRGADVNLKLGPLDTVAAYGYAQPAIEGEQYARRFIALRQELDLLLLETGLNFSQVIDETEGIGISEVNPEQNYVLSLDSGISLFGFSLGSEVATSIYFDNARGNIWDNVDSLDVLNNFMDEDSFDVNEIKNTLNNDVPNWVKEAFPLPFNPNNITSITQYFEAADLGGKVDLSMPFIYSDIEGSYYYYGPYFKSLTGSGERDAQGFDVAFDTDKIGGVIDMSLEYAQYRDNLDYVVNQVLADLLNDSSSTEPGEATEYTDYEGELGLYNRFFDTSIKYNYQESRDNQSLKLEEDQESYSVQLKGIEFELADWETSLRTKLTRDVESQYDEQGITVLSEKNTDTGSVKVSVERNSWEHSLGYEMKIEEDDSSEVKSPSISLNNAWSKRDLNLGFLNLYKFTVDSDISLTSTKGDSIDEQDLEYELGLDLKTSRNRSWEAYYKYSQRTDNLNQDNNESETSGQISYSISF